MSGPTALSRQMAGGAYAHGGEFFHEPANRVSEGPRVPKELYDACMAVRKCFKRGLYIRPTSAVMG